MTSIFLTFLSFVAFCLIGLCFSSLFKFNTALAPFVSACFTMLYFTFFGMFNLILPSGYIYFITAAIIAVLFATKKLELPKLSLWFNVFFFACVLMIILFGIKTPYLNSWDEFSYWGTAVKLMKLNDILPTTAQIGWPWISSQKVGLVVFNYFFMFFGNYEEWRIFIGVNVLTFSVFCALLAPFVGKKKHVGFIFSLVLFLSPYIFTIYRDPLEPSYIYMNAHSDLPMAWVFCGTIALYFVQKHLNGKFWPVLLSMAAFIMVKDTSLPLSLIAWVIISFDLLFFTNKKLRFKIINTLSMLFVIIANFLIWAAYIESATGADPLSDIGGTEQLSMAGMLISGTTMLFGINPSEKFIGVMNAMYTEYFNAFSTMIGTGFMITIIISALFIISAIWHKEKKQKLQFLSLGFLLFLGFVVYYIFLAFSFVFVFRGNETSYLVSYERYVYPYYITWFLMGVYALAMCAVNPIKKLFFAPKAALYFVLLVFSYRFYQFIPTGMTFLDYHDGYLYGRKTIYNTSQEIIELLGEDNRDNIYFISQNDDGARWFRYSTDLLPLQLEYGNGGGTMVLPENYGGELYHYAISPQEFSDYLIQNECKYVFVEKADEGLYEDYAFMFSDNLQTLKNGMPAIYEVTLQNGNVTLKLLSEVSP